MPSAAEGTFTVEHLKDILAGWATMQIKTNPKCVEKLVQFVRAAAAGDRDQILHIDLHLTGPYYKPVDLDD